MKGQKSYSEVSWITETGRVGDHESDFSEGTEVKGKRGAGGEHTALNDRWKKRRGNGQDMERVAGEIRE